MKDVTHKKAHRELFDEVSDETSVTPLRQKTVLVTRTREQAQEMTALLEGLGASVIHAPMIEIRAPQSWDALDQAIRQIHLYDWLLFTSANGVKFFFQRIEQKQQAPLADIFQGQIGAIGKATAQAIAAAGAKVDLIATDSKAEGFLQALVQHSGGAQALGGLQFLIPRARLARDLLPQQLRQLGARVDAVETYQNVMPETLDRALLLRRLREGAIDVIAFTSSSTVKHFAALAGTDDLSALLPNAVIACIGPITAATASQYHLQNIIQPAIYSAQALVEAIVEALSEK